jgi:hypothetical protein
LGKSNEVRSIERLSLLRRTNILTVSLPWVNYVPYTDWPLAVRVVLQRVNRPKPKSSKYAQFQKKEKPSYSKQAKEANDAADLINNRRYELL